MRKFDSNLLSGESLLDLGGRSATRSSSSVQFADLATTTALTRADTDWLQNFIQLADISYAGVDLSGAGGIEGYSIEFIPTDPNFGSQWHLRNTTAGQFDINVEDVWDDYTGNGIVVTVIDDGFRTTHDDLDGNYLFAQDYDYVNNDFVPVINSHGTATIGIIGAEEGNGLGGVGVAFDSDIRGYNGLSFSYFDDQIRDAAGLGNGVNNTNGNAFGGDVVSMSFGTGSNVFIDTTDVRSGITAMADASANGRGGLGQIHVKSSGNSRAAINSALREEGTAELSDSSKFTISVAALRQDGWITDFSTPGANVHISAFADNTSNNSSIYTTTSSSDTAFTSTFGGTSAAAPQVAGVVALMLEANADLGWRDVHEILALTARHSGSDVGAFANTGAPAGGGHEQSTKGSIGTWQFNGADSQLTWNGGGLHHSNDYGFGMIDALAAVRLAETWNLEQTSANDEFLFVNNLTAVGDTTPGAGAGNDWTTTIASGANFLVEHVTLELSATIDRLDQIEIVITSPNGTSIQLLADTGDTQAITLSNWDFGTPGFWGEEAVGTWTVNIVDEGGSGTTVTDIDLEFTGKAISTDALFIVTNEFSDYDGLFGHSTNFAGGGTGVDTINAAAVTSASTINLLTNSGTIDGVAITNSNIQVVYTGDGNDTIIGDAFSTELYGGRGNDTITSGSATENLFGGAGNDNITVGTGDTARGEDDNDTLTLLPGVYTGITLDGGAGTDKILVGDGPAIVDISDATNQLFSIEEIEFLANEVDAKTLIISAQELDSVVEVPANLLIDGNASGAGAPDTLQIEWVGAIVTTIDWSGWVFQDWDDTVDIIDINMDGAATTLTATIQADDIHGGAGNDIINGGGGDDVINGGLDMDTVDAGDGDDTIIDTETAGASNADVYDGGAGIDTLINNQHLWSSTVIFNLLTGEQTVSGNVRDTYANIENVTASGNASIIGDNNDNILIADDTFFSGDNVIDGNGGDDTINGGDGNDTLDGGSGNDTVDGSAGNDSVMGGGGNDILLGGDGNDLVFYNFGGSLANEYYGGTGTDTFDTNGVGFASNVVFDMSTNEMRFNGSLYAIWDSFENYDGATGTGGDEVIGNTLDNIITTGSGANTIYGEVDADTNSISTLSVNTVDAGAGNDIVYSSGQGTYLGGDGDDLMFTGLTAGGGTETLDGGAGIDTLDASLLGGGGLFAYNINLATGVTNFSGESFINFENLIMGDSDNVVVGTTGANTISTNGGNDTIDGAGGDDTIEGGDGADTLTGGTGNDTLSYASDTSAGVTVFLSSNTVSGGDATGDTVSGFENITGGSGADNLNGNSQVNIITGNAGVDSVFANGGADLVYGGDGDDTLRGGIGDDVIYGGNDNDNLQGNNQQDMLFGDAGNDTLTGGGGNDDLFGGADNDTLTGNSGQDELYGGTGDDDLSGNAGGDDLYGGAGADRLHGGGGNDDMWGDGGADIFEFTTGFRVDRIKDFEDGIDLIDVSGHSSWNNFADILADASQAGLNVIIQVNVNNRMVIENFDLADLDASDFIF